MSLRHVREWFRPHTNTVTVSYALLQVILQQGAAIMGDLATLKTAVETLSAEAVLVKAAVEAGKAAVEARLVELSAQVFELQTQVNEGTVTSETFDELTASVNAVGVTVKSIGVPTV